MGGISVVGGAKRNESHEPESCAPQTICPPPLRSRAAFKTFNLDRTAAQGAGTEDFLCVDECTGKRFTPKWLHAWLHEATSDQFGSQGGARFTDGQTIIRQYFHLQSIFFAGVGAVNIGQATSAAGNGFRIRVVASPDPKTVTLEWIVLGVGETVDGIMKVDGCL